MSATSSPHQAFRLRQVSVLACALIAVALLLASGNGARAKETPPPAPAPAKPDSAAAAASAAPADSVLKLAPEQLQSLVAPIALYPDDLLVQCLVASTYPLELVQLHQWLAKHPDLKDKALVDSVAAQPWDPSIQSMAALPEVVKRLSDDIQWTTDLGNAFLAQQSEVMDAVQAMRKKAKDNGALESNEQQKVETKVIEEKTVIVVESANPEVIYVPSYSPTVVYGAAYPYYPYPPIYYPYYPPGAAFVSFGMGMMWGAAMWGGSYGHCGWGGNNVYINNNNNFNKIEHHNRGQGNVGQGNRGQGGRGQGGGGNWQHNPSHRGGAPYADQRTANKYGGSTKGGRGTGAGVSDRSSGTGGQRGAGVSDGMGGTRGQSGAGVSDRSSQGNRGSASASDRSRGSSGSDRVGSRDIPRDSGSRNRSNSSNGFSGGSRGYDRGSAQSSRSRGSSSMGGSRGGGSRGGGGRGGGGRR